MEENIKTFCKILSDAAENNSLVKSKKGKNQNKKRKRPWTPELTTAAKLSKIHHAKWKAAGKPTDPNNLSLRNKKKYKKQLRSLQRRLEATIRNDKYQKIMELNENNDAEFFRLVRQQRDTSNSICSSLNFNNVTLNDDVEVREAWADYFEDLSTPTDHENFDNTHKTNVMNDLENLTNLYCDYNENNISDVTEDEVRKTISSFKNRKSPDEENIAAEHFKYGGPSLILFLTSIINFIFRNLNIPDLMKSGFACPILKKGKPATDPNSYRKITVTNFIGKIVEKIHLNRNEPNIVSKQSKLQKGFTRGEMPTTASLILTELIIEANKSKSTLYVALMDAKKAFDIVWHAGLLREVHKFGMEGDNWLFFKRWYDNVTSKVKWKNALSKSICEQQGVRQGGVWSPTAYKIFINNLLQTLESNQLGAYIGPIYCGIPTVADDVTLISNDPYELQTMLDVQTAHANTLRYLLSEQKSTILVFNDKKENSWSLNGKQLPITKSSVHLGITRDTSSKSGTKEVINRRIITARRTTYSNGCRITRTKRC